MAALWQRGRSQTPGAAAGFKSPPMHFGSEPLDSDTDSDESDAEPPLPSEGPKAVPAQHTALAATASGKSAPSKAAGSPSQSGLLWRLGALRRSVSPVKMGAAGASSASKSAQQAPPASCSNSDASGTSTATAALKQPKQQATSGQHGSRSQTRKGGAAEAGRALHSARPSEGAARTAASSSMLNAAHEGRNSGRQPSGQQDNDAARHPASGGHKATVAVAVAAAGIARSGSDASSLITDTTVASGVSSGLGNARTAADSYGGSVFASALNQEAGLQLLSQVQPLCGLLETRASQELKASVSRNMPPESPFAYMRRPQCCRPLRSIDSCAGQRDQSAAGEGGRPAGWARRHQPGGGGAAPARPAGHDRAEPAEAGPAGALLLCLAGPCAQEWLSGWPSASYLAVVPWTACPPRIAQLEPTSKPLSASRYKLHRTLRGSMSRMHAVDRTGATAEDPRRHGAADPAVAGRHAGVV